MKKVIIKNILWDVDSPEDLEILPKEVTLTFTDGISDFEDRNELECYLSDYLSDEYGYCHKGFTYDIR